MEDSFIQSYIAVAERKTDVAIERDGAKLEAERLVAAERLIDEPAKRHLQAAAMRRAPRFARAPLTLSSKPSDAKSSA